MTAKKPVKKQIKAKVPDGALVSGEGTPATVVVENETFTTETPQTQSQNSNEDSSLLSAILNGSTPQETSNTNDDGNDGSVDTTISSALPRVNVDFSANEGNRPLEQKVRIKLRQDHKCFIGGVSYVFKKGQCYNVPKNVKTVLSKRSLLDVL